MLDAGMRLGSMAGCDTGLQAGSGLVCTEFVFFGYVLVEAV